MNKKIIATLVASAIVAGIVTTGVSANLGDNFSSERWEYTHMFKKGHNGNLKGLTDEEKTALESMTTEEKQTFIETKKAEKKAEREAKKAQRESYETVIDKLLAWETLTSAEENLRSEIIEKRAERKAKKEAKQAEMEEIRTIMEKKRAGEELTADEEAKIENLKSKFGKKRWSGHKRGGNR